MRTIADQIDDLREAYADRELSNDRNPTEDGFVESLVIKDTWQAGPEVDALLAQLRGERAGLVDALNRMSTTDIAQFGQHLWHLQTVLADVAVAKARGREIQA